MIRHVDYACAVQVARIGSPVGGPHSLGEIRGAAAMKKTATGGEGAEASASGRNKKCVASLKVF